jgi:predicted transcriptional regulator
MKWRISVPKREARRLRRQLTPEEKQRWPQARKEADAEKEEILAKGRRIKAARNRARVAIRDALKTLKVEREAQGLSLSDIEHRSGIGRAALSRLENETEPNPTMVTLTRYAEALGKRLVVSLESPDG